MSKSTGSRTSRKAPGKPKKPYPEFPLTPHPLGYWCKKVNGKVLHFGRWGRLVKGVTTPVEDQEAAWRDALANYKARIDDVQAGDIGPGPVVTEKAEATDGYLVKDLCNEFRTAKLKQLEAGELTARMYAEYVLMCDLVIAQFGKDRRVEGLKPEDFAALRETMVKRWGPLRVLNGVTRVKTIFKFGFESGKLDRPPRYGQGFKPPSASVLRRHKAKAGPKLFEADAVRAMIDGAEVEGQGGAKVMVKPDPVMRAMILLGVNCGFGNGDVAGLNISAVNLETGWANFPRPKTGIQRRCPLWPETVEAIRAALAVRPKPATAADCGLVFLTYRGTAFVRQGDKSRSDYVSQGFNRLVKALGIAKPGCGFYTLRHVFRTVADGSKDIPAVREIMGQVNSGIDATDRGRVEADRLRAIVDHVRAWFRLGTAVVL